MASQTAAPDVESRFVPTYAYACSSCGHRFDIYQAFSDDPLTECPECGGALRKQFGNVGVVFKGSGFYRNDARGKSTDSASTSSTSSESSTSSSTKESTSKESTSKDSSSKPTTAAPASKAS